MAFDANKLMQQAQQMEQMHAGGGGEGDRTVLGRGGSSR
jgi:hypothetical protein